jgi:hypothetical protein
LLLVSEDPSEIQNLRSVLAAERSHNLESPHFSIFFNQPEILSCYQRNSRKRFAQETSRRIPTALAACRAASSFGVT